jgi:dolichol-phosphate mannosyltransferase
MTKFEIGIVIPTYNEKDNIEQLLRAVKNELGQNSIRAALLVIDDSSPDGTSEIVAKLIPELKTDHFDLRLTTRPGKMGLASAYIQGFSALSDECEFLQSMDADFSHQPKYLPALLAKIRQGHDLVIGSRNISGGGVEDWGPTRLLVSKIGSLYAKTILLSQVNDFTGGFNLYRTSMLNKFYLEKIKANGYLFQIEMKYTVERLGGKIAEVPIWFIDRQKGKSKFSRGIFLEAMLGVFRLRFQNIKNLTK